MTLFDKVLRILWSYLSAFCIFLDTQVSQVHISQGKPMCTLLDSNKYKEKTLWCLRLNKGANEYLLVYKLNFAPDPTPLCTFMYFASATFFQSACDQSIFFRTCMFPMFSCQKFIFARSSRLAYLLSFAVWFSFYQTRVGSLPMIRCWEILGGVEYFLV